MLALAVTCLLRLLRLRLLPRRLLPLALGGVFIGDDGTGQSSHAGDR